MTSGEHRGIYVMICDLLVCYALGSISKSTFTFTWLHVYPIYVHITRTHYWRECTRSRYTRTRHRCTRTRHRCTCTRSTCISRVPIIGASVPGLGARVPAIGARVPAPDGCVPTITCDPSNMFLRLRIDCSHFTAALHSSNRSWLRYTSTEKAVACTERASLSPGRGRGCI